MRRRQGLTWVTGPTAEFSWSYDPGRRCFVIWRAGHAYHVLQTGKRFPAHTETYVKRAVCLLNGDPNGGS